MNTKQIYYLKKFAQAERTAKKAVETTVSHRSLSEFGAALGKQDHILYGKGSVVKRANMPRRASAGSASDYLMYLLQNNTIAAPVGIPMNIAGSLAGFLAPAEKQSKNFTASTLIPGVPGYKLSQRLRQSDIERSGGKRDRSAQLHELAGGITSSLLVGLLGAGAGAGIGALVSRGASNRDKALNIGGGAALGGGLGTTLGGLINMGALPVGFLFNGEKKSREDYLKGGMWKNYLIPGRALYQSGSRLRDALENT